MKCRVSKVAGKEAQMNLISFQNGEMLAEEGHKLSCAIYVEKSSGRKLATVASDDGFTYRGYERTDVNQYAQLLLAVRNKTTNKVRLFPTSSFLLAPVFQEPEKVSDIPVEEESNLHKALGRAFGSKKTKRSVEYAARMATGMESLKSQLNSAVLQVSTNENMLQNFSSLEKDEIALYLPPCNREAENVADVYKLCDLVTPEEIDSLRQEAVRITKQIDQSSAGHFSEFFRKCLPILVRISGTEMLEKLCILLYIESLISFLKIPAKRLQAKKIIICPYSSIINQKILTSFTKESDRGRVRPNSLKDKAICYIIVLGLLLCSYELDLQILSQSLGAPVKRLLELSQVVGAVLKSRESTVVVLKLPLSQLRPFSRRTKRVKKR